MAWRAVIAGVDRTDELRQAAGVRIELQQNERARATFVGLPGYVPSRRDECVLYAQDGVTAIFGGVVLHRRLAGLATSTAQALVTVQCVDWSVYGDWCYVSLDYPSGATLKDVVQDVVTAKLSAYGIAVDPAQVTGPTLGAFSWTRKRVSDALRELSTKTGYVFRFDPSKQLRFTLPGASAAPVTLTDAAPNCSEFGWEDPADVPATDVVVLCGPSGVGSELFEQVWVASGIARSWSLAAAVPASSVWPGVVWLNSGGGYAALPIWPAGEAPGGSGIEWDDATDGGTLSFVGSEPTPASGTLIKLLYYPLYPFEAHATTGAAPAVEAQYSAPDVLTWDAGQELAEGLLDQVAPEPREPSWHSLVHGWLPGQTTSVSLTSRSFAGSVLTTRVMISLVNKTRWEYDVKGVESSVYTGSELDRLRADLGGTSAGSSAVVVSGSGGGSTTTLSSPAYLGGSRIASVPMGASPAYTPVLSWVPFYAAATFTGRVRVELWARTAGVGVTARLYDVTAGAAVGTSSEVTSPTAVETTFTVVITSGHAYRLDIISDTASESAYGIGQLEAA